MRMAQEEELIQVENAQRLQFTEFSEAWDKYMKDYENAAFESVERLKEKHIQEIKDMQADIVRSYSIKTRWSKELMELRKQEKTFFSLKNYAKAEELK